MASLYHVLKVAPDAPIEVIRAAYRVLAARHHPDRSAGDPGAVARMQHVNEAYRVLSDPELRARHDAALTGQRRRRASDGGRETGARDGMVRADHAGSPAPVPSSLLRQRAAAYAAHEVLGRCATGSRGRR